ncbi:MAG TPA: nucleotide exchange factor GrpE [Tepidisphaeraceae bacterium]|nr:nucleotide exchange factor GrpE [Tepidisphaeraceae bacterium]
MSEHDHNITDDEPNLDDLANAAEAEAQAAGRSGVEGASNELIEARAQRDDALNRLARIQADFANSRRRLEADAEQRQQYANSALIKALLPAIDNFERALAVEAATDTASVLKGLQLVHDQILAVLAQQQVALIAPSEGDAFDPNMHEAVMQQDSDKYAEPAILQTLQKGYALRGRTLRPASVIVSKAQ